MPREQIYTRISLPPMIFGAAILEATMTPKRRRATLMLIAVGFISALVIMCLFVGLFMSSTEKLLSISKGLYIHPFAVSNAAAELKTSLYQMRSKALVVVLMKEQGDTWRQSVQIINKYEQSAVGNLNVIKESFLGDKSKVAELESKIIKWHELRNQILEDVRLGNFMSAEESIRNAGTPIFDEIIELADYVQSYAKWRAKTFVETGESESSELVSNGIALAFGMVATFVFIAAMVFWRINFLQKELHKFASTDYLTGVCNRRTFLQELEEELLRAGRYGHSLSLVVVDLDHFKKINDTDGHQAGDLVLKEFCRLCKANLRDADVLGRLGGEEFGILMPHTPEEASLEGIERLRSAIEGTRVSCQGKIIRFTASFGVADYFLGCTADQLIANADAGLYKAKEQGRNCIRFIE